MNTETLKNIAMGREIGKSKHEVEVEVGFLWDKLYGVFGVGNLYTFTTYPNPFPSYYDVLGVRRHRDVPWLLSKEQASVIAQKLYDVAYTNGWDFGGKREMPKFTNRVKILVAKEDEDALRLEDAMRVYTEKELVALTQIMQREANFLDECLELI